MIRLKISAGAISLAFAIASIHAEDWPHWRGPHFDGISMEKNWNSTFPADGPKQLWKANVGTGFSSMSVSNGRLYTMGNAADIDSVFCFDAETGKPLWKHSYPCKLDPHYYEGGPSATPTVDGNSVFTLGRNGDLFALNASDGKVIWKKNLTQDPGATAPMWGFAGSVVVQGNLLLLNAGSAGTALEKSTGKVIWTTGKERSGYSTPQPAELSGKPSAVVFGEKNVFAVTIADGKKLWEHPWKTFYDLNAAQPIVVGDKVFISTGYNHGCALLQIKGNAPTVVWENKNLRNHLNSSVLIGGFLYGFDGDTGPRTDFKCVEFQTGIVKWTQPKLGAGALMAADGKLIVATDKGELVIAMATPEGFKAISRAQVLGGRNWTTPVLANGRIYCRNAKGDLVCLDVRK